MNPWLQAALTDILNATLSSATEAKKFLVAELPDVVQQLLLWEMWYSALWQVVYVLLIWISIWLLKRYSTSIKTPRDEENHVIRETDSEEAVRIISGVAGMSVGSAMGAICFFNALENWTWLKILVAPKVFLIEYAAKLATGG